jgi:dUTP pyrophosphatase
MLNHKFNLAIPIPPAIVNIMKKWEPGRFLFGEVHKTDVINKRIYTKMNIEKPQHNPIPDEEDIRFPVKFVNESDNPDPEYATDGASGFDIRANLTESVVLKPLQRALIPTGLFFELHKDDMGSFDLQVRPRSGLAIKNGVTVLNTPGTVDNDYRGEVKVILVNLGQEDFTVNHGDRIAQGVIGFVIAKNEVRLKNTKSIDKNTERGDGGFGSTGQK